MFSRQQEEEEKQHCLSTTTKLLWGPLSRALARGQKVLLYVEDFWVTKHFTNTSEFPLYQSDHEYKKMRWSESPFSLVHISWWSRCEILHILDPFTRWFSDRTTLHAFGLSKFIFRGMKKCLFFFLLLWLDNYTCRLFIIVFVFWPYSLAQKIR